MRLADGRSRVSRQKGNCEGELKSVKCSQLVEEVTTVTNPAAS